MTPRRTNQILVLPDGRELPIWQVPISAAVLGGVGVPSVSTTALEFPPRLPAPAPQREAIAAPKPPQHPQRVSARPERRWWHADNELARLAGCAVATVAAWRCKCPVPPRIRETLNALTRRAA
jgi:hypothetical protein